jgi:hypothetical protein
MFRPTHEDSPDAARIIPYESYALGRSAINLQKKTASTTRFVASAVQFALRGSDRLHSTRTPQAGVRRRHVQFYFARLTARCGLRVVMMARPLHFILHFRRAFDAAVCISISRGLLRDVVCALFLVIMARPLSFHFAP